MKSYKLPIVGWLAKKIRAIPVERPQDVAQSGAGTITIESMTKIIGKGTQFKKEFEKGDGIVASVGPKFNVEEIMSDTEMIVKTFEKDETLNG